MASQTIPLSPTDLIIIATDTRVRELTEFQSEARQVRNGRPLIALQALVIVAGTSLGVVTVQTSERDLSALTSGLALTGIGRADITNAGTRDEWGIRSTVYVEQIEPTAVNAWPLLAEAVRRSAQASAK